MYTYPFRPMQPTTFSEELCFFISKKNAIGCFTSVSIFILFQDAFFGFWPVFETYIVVVSPLIKSLSFDKLWYLYHLLFVLL